jgi:hypothetical protein
LVMKTYTVDQIKSQIDKAVAADYPDFKKGYALTAIAMIALNLVDKNTQVSKHDK